MPKPKPKKPKPKKQRSDVPPIVALAYGHTRAARILLYAIGYTCLFIVAGYIFIYFQYGGLRGLRLEGRKFPGANSPAVAAGRDTELAKAKLLDSMVGTASPLKAVAASAQRTTDLCVKGRHELGIGFGGSDPYAHHCSISSLQFYGYDASVCEVAAKLAAIEVSFDTTEDCTSTVPALQKGASANYFNGDDTKAPGLKGLNIAIHDRAKYLSVPLNLNPLTPLPNRGCNDPRRIIYCNQQNEDMDNTKTIKGFPTSVQTVLYVQLFGATYYEE